MTWRDGRSSGDFHALVRTARVLVFIGRIAEYVRGGMPEGWGPLGRGDGRAHPE
jgi:hypothetical protein